MISVFSRRSVFWISLLFVQILIALLVRNQPDFVEHYYSNSLYLFTSRISRKLLGNIPISIGDLLYGLTVLGLLYLLIRKFKSKVPLLQKMRYTLLLTIQATLVFFFFFNLLWGYNNYRIPLNQKLGINDEYTEEELIDFTKQLIDKTNLLQLIITKDSIESVTIPYSKKTILQKASQGLQKLSEEEDWLSFDIYSIKMSMWSIPLTYMGFSGYINPFTNEAQVNHKIPKLGMMVTATHEASHQAGFAKESEANFIGYLASKRQEDILFQYAATIYALRYCLSTLERNNPEAWDTLVIQLNYGAQINLVENQHFWMEYRNVSNSFFKSFYSGFLKVNNQTEGIKTYNRFVDLLINYHKKEPL